MGRRLDVLVAIPALDRDGPARVVFELLCAFDRRRCRPSLLVSRRDGHYLSRLPGDVEVEVIADGRYPVWSSLRAIRRRAPDVVLSTQRMNLTLGAVASALPRRTRWVARQANDFSADAAQVRRTAPIKQRIVELAARRALRAADAVICQSEAMRADLRRQLGPAAHLVAIDNPIDVAAAQAQAAAHGPTLPGDPALVSVGRLSPQKGFDLLLPAVAALRGAYPRLHLTILGDGPERAALASQAASLGLASHVTFAGFVDDVLPRVRSADLFVLASRYEGFPNAALEALAVGTPVVLTDCPGANATIVDPGHNGRLAERIDAAAMTAAIATALAERTQYVRDAIRAATAARYGAASIAARYLAALEAVVDGSRPA